MRINVLPACWRWFYCCRSLRALRPGMCFRMFKPHKPIRLSKRTWSATTFAMFVWRLWPLLAESRHSSRSTICKLPFPAPHHGCNGFTHSVNSRHRPTKVAHRHSLEFDFDSGILVRAVHAGHLFFMSFSGVNHEQINACEHRARAGLAFQCLRADPRCNTIRPTKSQARG